MSNPTSTRACYTCARIANLMPKPGDLRLFGTWDFKWPHGHTVTIAFQKLVGDEKGARLAKHRQAFLDAIEPWKRSRARIKFATAERDLPAPANEREAKSYLQGHVPISYDVLVSFADMPQTLPITERRPGEVEVDTQSSELGSYSRRVDYGVPTLFVGPAAGRSREAHFERTWFTATACHEFGHALGLAHTHQNPLFRVSQPTPDVTNKTIEQLTDAFPAARPPEGQQEIEEEIVLPWPHVVAASGGAIAYSDWLMPPGADLDRLSVMAHFGWSIIANGARDGSQLTEPTPFDLEQLETIYQP